MAVYSSNTDTEGQIKQETDDFMKVDGGSIGDTDFSSPTRGFFLEIVLNMVVFVICLMVCLQIMAAAMLTSEKSGVISRLGLESQSIVECWKSGYGLQELADEFKGTVVSGQLHLYFDRQNNQVDRAEDAWYMISFVPSGWVGNFESGELKLMHHDDVLIHWQVGRHQLLGKGA
ncbi:MAG: hypothetical protein FWF71_05655 [Actinomycetia bacterium]|nr:hypothetical protein [Actinomycetes bacterium]